MRSYVSIGRGGPRYGVVFSGRGRAYDGSPAPWGPLLLVVLAFAALVSWAGPPTVPPDPMGARIAALSMPARPVTPTPTARLSQYGR
jgi:hypothetical protein